MNVVVKIKEIITHKAENIPRSEKGANSEPAKEPTPIAVVTEVIAMARPEWPKV